MTNAEIIKILTQHNAWRRGSDDLPQVLGAVVGKAIDAAIAALSAQAAEPVAWLFPSREVLLNDDIDFVRGRAKKANAKPLYRHPPLAARELTDAEIWQLAIDCNLSFEHGTQVTKFARALMGKVA